MHYRLAFDAEGFPMLYFFEGKCSNMIRTLPELKYDSINPEDVDTKQEDHLYDALKYFLMSNPILILLIILKSILLYGLKKTVLLKDL